MNQVRKLSQTLWPEPAPMPGEANDEWLDLQALARIVRRRIWVVLLIFVAVTALATISIKEMKPSYSAQARLLLHDPLTVDLSPTDNSPQNRANTGTEIERFLSRDVAVRVIQDQGLDRLPEFNSALREPSLLHNVIADVKHLIFGPTDAGATEDDQIRLVIPAYLAHLGMYRQDGSDVVNVGFTSQNPELAASVPNALIRIYLEERERQYRSRVDANVDWLSERIDEQRKRVDAAREDATARRNAQDMSSPDALGVGAAISSLSDRRIAIRRDLAATQARLDKMKAEEASAIDSEVVDTDRMMDLKLEHQKARSDLTRLQQQYGQNHSQVTEVRRKIGELETAIRFEFSAQMQQLANHISALNTEEQTNLAEMEEARQTLGRYKEAESELSSLERNAAQEQDLLLSLEQQKRALLSDTERPFTEVSVLAPASVPLQADGRGRSFYLAAAMIGAALVALSVAFGLELLDTTLRSGAQLRRLERVWPAGIVPRFRPRSTGTAATPAGLPLADSAFTDAIRGVLLSIEHAAGGTIPSSFLVSSALPREGKTTIATALAAELAASGHRVLLVDADLRHGKLHTLFDLEPSPGLAEYLSGQRALSSVIHHNVAQGIDVLSRGDGTRASLPSRQKLAALIQVARSADQIVILDSPPALGTIDTASLASLVACPILVADWGRTKRAAVEAAVQRLTLGTESQINIVINRVNLRRQAFYAYHDAGPFARAMRKFHDRAA